MRSLPAATFSLALALAPGVATAAPSAVGPGGSVLRIAQATHGFGQLLPHRMVDPLTLLAVDVTTLEELDAYLSQGYVQLSPVAWPTTSTLPNGTAGNHYVAVRFSEPLAVDSVLDASLAGATTSHLTGAITVTAYDPATGAVVPVPGQPFVDGKTYGGSIAGSSYVLEPWVEHDPLDLDGDGLFVETVPVGATLPGLGFPGTETPPFAGLEQLFGLDTFVFVFDADGLLASHETAPRGWTIRVTISTAVRGRSGASLAEKGLISTTVGADALPPAVLTTGGAPQITPADGDVGVDPETDVEIRFSETMDLATLGPPPSTAIPSIFGAVLLEYGLPAVSVAMPFRVRPASVFDFSHVVLDPVEAFPGAGSAPAGCAQLDAVDVIVSAGFAQDTWFNPIASAATASFTTGLGQGLVNAPIAPDAIYVGRKGGSLSVVDLNGFGGGTGSPRYHVVCPVGPDQTNFPNNPNVALQGAILVPPLAPGACTIDGGSAGVLTLARDSSLDDRFLRGAIAGIDDMALGHSLDRVWNNGEPFGCVTGAGNLCAATQHKLFAPVLGGPNTLQPSDGASTPILVVQGGENPISWAPHPNPPPLALPPACGAPPILGIEPTSVDTPVINLLTPGPFPFGDPLSCFPPVSLLAAEQNAFFQGPSPDPSDSGGTCGPFAFRQQIGQFLYAVDRAAGELLVLNSNRMTVLQRIALPDPARLAMSPNLHMLAVTNRDAGVVSFIDVDPHSATFHEIVKTTAVGAAPLGIAWTSGNEDVLVCNEGDGTVSVISAFTLEVRKTLTGFLSQPFDVVTTPRQDGFGLNRNVYYGWILNRDGALTLFESGPAGPSGWGYDDCIGVAPFTFARPRALQPDPRDLDGAVYVAHQLPLDPATGSPTGVRGAALSRVHLDAAVHAMQPLAPGTQPNLRDLFFVLDHSLDRSTLTGVAADLAFDDQRNLGSLPNVATPFSAGSPLVMNGKGLVKQVPGVGFENANEPRYLFLAVPSSSEGPGVVDVIDLATLTRVDTDLTTPGTQSIPAAGAAVLMDYFRQ